MPTYFAWVQGVIGVELAKKIVAEWLPLEFVDGKSTPKVQAMRDIDECHRK